MTRLEAGSRVQTWTGQVGMLVGWTSDGWAQVHLDGEVTVSGTPRIDEWQESQITPARGDG